MPEEGKGFDGALGEEEDDDGRGDGVARLGDGNPDGHPNNIVVPQRKALYQAAKKKMRKKRRK